jgi:hypothetical protein
MHCRLIHYNVLKAAGLPENQAKAIADILCVQTEQLATKSVKSGLPPLLIITNDQVAHLSDPDVIGFY